MTDKRKPSMPSLDASAFAAAAVPQPDPVQVATSPQGIRLHEHNPVKASKTVAPSSRAGKVQLNVWVSPEIRQRLLHRKADTGQSIEEMVTAAIDTMLMS